jgi:hypothetical protein
VKTLLQNFLRLFCTFSLVSIPEKHSGKEHVLTKNISPACWERLEKLLFAEEVRDSAPEKKIYRGKETGHAC